MGVVMTKLAIDRLLEPCWKNCVEETVEGDNPLSSLKDLTFTEGDVEVYERNMIRIIVEGTTYHGKWCL